MSTPFVRHIPEDHQLPRIHHVTSWPGADSQRSVAAGSLVGLTTNLYKGKVSSVSHGTERILKRERPISRYGSFNQKNPSYSRTPNLHTNLCTEMHFLGGLCIDSRASTKDHYHYQLTCRIFFLLAALSFGPDVTRKQKKCPSLCLTDSSNMIRILISQTNENVLFFR